MLTFLTVAAVLCIPMLAAGIVCVGARSCNRTDVVD